MPGVTCRLGTDDLCGRRDGLASLLADRLFEPGRADPGVTAHGPIGDLEQAIEAAIDTSALARVIDSGDAAAAFGRKWCWKCERSSGR